MKERNPKAKKISELLPRTELLAQCAEECCELAQACHKLRRVYDGINPTPVTEEQAAANIVEEFSDIVGCLECLGLFESDYIQNAIKETIDRKQTRWIDRIEANNSKK